MLHGRPDLCGVAGGVAVAIIAVGATKRGDCGSQAWPAQGDGGGARIGRCSPSCLGVFPIRCGWYVYQIWIIAASLLHELFRKAGPDLDQLLWSVSGAKPQEVALVTAFGGGEAA